MNRLSMATVVLVVIGLGLGAGLPAQAPGATEKVLVRAARPSTARWSRGFSRSAEP